MRKVARTRVIAGTEASREEVRAAMHLLPLDRHWTATLDEERGRQEGARGRVRLSETAIS